ncbi:serine/threonine-protein phosphatase 6 regulatory subunit 3 [Trichogramma pretiosum]|uniref:serine/threonine-protein phosphatase 6 regulatory subunit 3 n=1 Tax=Trichogramma pretiosum TaxID=7493 RepID=UPI0006C96F9A|nr:serine/threonine-protein phosphatase 6 regulatory subunit 3 [Trichogramma pretiosum]XP_023314502.1 serine/threonine-protein phosphatase 6 regulatory subunit 3 [Trichogramma pretiosum]
MFWHNNYAPSAEIENLLNEEDVTLNKLMDAEDILQECKTQNKKLLDFLTRADILEELVDLITIEPSTDLEERKRYKYSNIACELLTCDSPPLTKKLAGNDVLLAKLYSFIDREEPLNPLLASFFSKTLHALLRQPSDQDWFSYQFVCLQVLESLKNRKNCVDLLLQHLGTSAIMDLILILLTKIEGSEMRQNIFTWLDDQNLIQRLIKLLSPTSDPEKHTNASQLLCDIIRHSRMEMEKQPTLILQTLQSEETIRLILDTILVEEKVETSIVGGIRVLNNILGQKKEKDTETTDGYGSPFNNHVEDEEREKFIPVIIPYISRLNNLLIDPPVKASVKTTAGLVEKPFGMTRLYILKLYVNLLSTQNLDILTAFAELNTFSILLDLFFEFSWNNFLHSQVQKCLSLALKCSSSDVNAKLFDNIFIKARCIERLLEVWDEDYNKRKDNKGHLVVIANDILIKCSEDDDFNSFLKKNLSEPVFSKWEDFVSTKLHDTNENQKMSLGSPKLTESSGDEYASSMSTLTWLKESFMNSQDQPNASSNVSCYQPILEAENCYFNFQSDKFHDVDAEMNSLEQMNQQSLNLSQDSEFLKSQEIFNNICDDVSSAMQWGQSHDCNTDQSDWLKNEKNSSSSSDEDEGSRDFGMEDNSTDLWGQMKSLSMRDASSPINLWSSNTVEPVEQTGWANFEEFSSAPCEEGLVPSTQCEKPEAEIVNVPAEPENPVKSELLSPIIDADSSIVTNEPNLTHNAPLDFEDENLSRSSDSSDEKSSEIVPDSNTNATETDGRPPQTEELPKS